LNLHPSAELLALFTTADLPLLDRWKIRRHIGTCEQCEHEVALFRASDIEFQRQARTETLTGFEAIADWSRLEREMEGNIIVGLAAARCIERGADHRGLLIKFSLAAAMLLLFVLGWVTHVPNQQSARILTAVRGAFDGSNQSRVYEGPFLRTQADGIVVGSQEGSLTILHPATAVVSLSGPSSVEARYVDDETGQVTITDVYGQ
jgi:hypothetical protein